MAGFLALASSASAQLSPADTIISDLYESISFTKNSSPDYETFKSLFKDGAQLISVGDTTSHTLSPADYEQAMTQQRESGKLIAFEERELHRETETFGNIMHVFSTYQTHVETPEGTQSSRGINSIQFIKEDRKWKIVSITWYDENDGHPLPEKYLPSTNAN